MDQRLSDTALTTRHVGDVGTNRSTSPRLGVRLGAAAALLILPIEEFPERSFFAMPTNPGGGGVLSLQLVVNDRLTVRVDIPPCRLTQALLLAVWLG